MTSVVFCVTALLVLFTALFGSTNGGCFQQCDCLKNECCVSINQPRGKRSSLPPGRCQALGQQQSRCLVNFGSASTPPAGLVQACPCSGFLECKGTGRFEVPQGEIAFNISWFGFGYYVTQRYNIEINFKDIFLQYDNNGYLTIHVCVQESLYTKDELYIRALNIETATLPVIEYGNKTMAKKIFLSSIVNCHFKAQALNDILCPNK